MRRLNHHISGTLKLTRHQVSFKPGLREVQWHLRDLEWARWCEGYVSQIHLGEVRAWGLRGGCVSAHATAQIRADRFD